MARGRKKDLTIPPSRTLVQQRDYRARRALYVATLEERCRKSEEENVQLRKELAEARERLVNPAVLLPETVAASSELLHHLSSARDALVKFNQLVFPDTRSRGEVAPPHLNHIASSSSHSHSATPLSSTSLGSHSHNLTIPRSRKELYVDDSYPIASLPSSPTTTIMSEVPSWNSSECCGGIITCEDEDSESNVVLSRTSRMRSTAE